jgi:hypothetical protein
VENRELIMQTTFDPERPAPAGLTLLIGGQHGDEPATVELLDRFCSSVLPLARQHPTAVLARANPDGLVRSSRYNARGVDLNRNSSCNWRSDSVEPSGSEPWSEPESRALRDFILHWRPRKIVSLHWALAEIDADGAQSTRLAESMWAALTPEQQAPYRLRLTGSDDGPHQLEETYAICPGSLGQWCGYALQYPDRTAPAMITLELPYDPDAAERPEELPSQHLAEVHRRWAEDPAGYLRSVAPGVQAMLLAAVQFSRI